MHARVRRRPVLSETFFRAFLVAALLGAFGWGLAHADIIIMKDGYTLRGSLKRDTTVIIDPESKQPIAMPKETGFFRIDDGARRISFSHLLVQEVSEADRGQQREVEQFQNRFTRLDNFRVPSGLFAGFTSWNAKWDRTVKLKTGEGMVSIAEHLSLLNPNYLRMDARRYNWSPHYLTREMEPDIVRELLYNHQDLKLSGSDKEKDAAKRFRVFHFLVQTGWYDKALEELDVILSEFPDQKEKVESSRTDLKKIVAGQFVEMIERAQKAGRHAWAQEKLATFPQQGTEEKLLARLRTLQNAYETSNKNLTSARRFLQDEIAGLENSSYRQLFTEAVAAITAELNLDTVSRLEPFVNLAEQAGREKQQNRTPSYSSEQLLALAASGWVLGSGSADPKAETAARLWHSRQFVLDYQRSPDSSARKSMMAGYEKNGRMAVDELAQLITLLPPPESFQQAALRDGLWGVGFLPFMPPALLTALFTAQSSAAGSALEMHLDSPERFRKGPTYWLQMPPEYHVGRSYPVLFVLHESNQKPDDMIKRWGTLAAQNGYFLVAPEWEQGRSKNGYQYNGDDHAVVVDVLRDLHRLFQIDSDRVFLFGMGEGGNMAYDVGLSHPDLFAGVIPMSGRPRYFARSYWRNALALPFYVVDGDMNADVAKANLQQFRDWIPRGYPGLYVQYKGRGAEWFVAELPYVFDWMSRKKRAFPIPDLGRGGNGGLFSDDFQSMRPTDDRFYWLQGEGLAARNTNDSRDWKNSVAPATMQARINEANQINVNIRGFKRGTIWFKQGMIEFDKPVTIRVNNRAIFSNRKITPSLPTLLEDFRVRGDHQRLFLAKFEFEL